MERSGLSAKRADAVTNRARILDVAQALFAEHGLDLEISEVASRANLGVGTLYRHFGSREDLLRAIVTRTVDDAIAQLQSAVMSATDDPLAALQALVSAGLHIHQQYHTIFVIMRDPRMPKLFDSAQGLLLRSRFLEVPRNLIDQGIKAGVFRDDLDRDIAAATIFGSFTSAFDLLGIQYSLDELTERLFHLLLMMLTGKAEK